VESAHSIAVGSSGRVAPLIGARRDGVRRSFCGDFFDFYNHEHRHSGIGYHTPASVHFGTASEIRAGRALVLASAYEVHPDRVVNGMPTPPQLPGSAWINRPKEEPAQMIR